MKIISFRERESGEEKGIGGLGSENNIYSSLLSRVWSFQDGKILRGGGVESTVAGSVGT